MRILFNIILVLLLSACSMGTNDSNLESTLFEFENLEKQNNLSDFSKGSLQLVDNVEVDFTGKTSRIEILNNFSLSDRLSIENAKKLGLDYSAVSTFFTFDDDDVQLAFKSLENSVLKPYDMDGSRFYFGNIYLPHLGGVVYPEMQMQKLNAFSVETLTSMLQKYPKFNVESFKIGPNSLIDVVRYTDASGACKKSKTIVFGEDLNLSFFSPCEVFDINSIMISFKKDNKTLVNEFLRELKFGDIENVHSENTLSSVSGEVDKLNSLAGGAFVTIVDVQRVSLNKFKVVLEAPVMDIGSHHFIKFDLEAGSQGDVRISNVNTSIDYLTLDVAITGLEVNRDVDSIDLHYNDQRFLSLCEDMPRCNLELHNFQMLKDDVISFRYSSGVQNLRAVFYSTKLNKIHEEFGPYNALYKDRLYFCSPEGLGKMGLRILDLNSFDISEVVTADATDIIVNCKGFNKHNKKFEYDVVNTSEMTKFYNGDESLVRELEV